MRRRRHQQKRVYTLSTLQIGMESNMQNGLTIQRAIAYLLHVAGKQPATGFGDLRWSGEEPQVQRNAAFFVPWCALYGRAGRESRKALPVLHRFANPFGSARPFGDGERFVTRTGASTMANTVKRTPARTRTTSPSTCRKNLSFITWGPYPGGAIGIQSHWCVPHDPDSLWDQGLKIGRMLFDEVRQLAAENPEEAKRAIVQAINTPDWQPSGWGIETGFTEALAEFALLGLTASRQEVRHAA